jgi:DNA-directed RNA polymerase specialized sigma24 family protein
VTHPITDRSRSELIAELYDRHATGLFNYCHDQLGDADSAADALVALLGFVPAAEPPRALLYALARREIYRRDIVYSPPLVDPAADPVTALIERVFRELRSHQREVLLLSVVCGLTVDELALVLDVAADTAADLTETADHRFTQVLAFSLASTGHASQQVREVYGALSVAPTRDVLARLPWRMPPALLRAQVYGALGLPGRRPPGAQTSLPVKPLWPTTSVWPVPPVENDELIDTGVHELGAGRPGLEPGRSARHDATTEPMPALGRKPSRRRMPLSAPVPADVLDNPPQNLFAVPVPADLLDNPLQNPFPSSVPADILDNPSFAAPAAADILDSPPRNSFTRPAPADVLDSPPENLFVPPVRQAKPEPVYLMPLHLAPEEEVAAGESTDVFEVPGLSSAPASPAEQAVPTKAGAGQPTKAVTTKGGSRRAGPRRTGEDIKAAGTARRRGLKPIKIGEHRFDWAWELIGFIICVAIALIVFFAMPTVVTP